MRVLRSKLSEGMVLDSDAMDRSGRMLMSAGTEITAHLIDVLENARIPIVYVTDPSFEEHSTAKEPEPLSKQEERVIVGRFRHVDCEGTFAKALLEEVVHAARERKDADREEGAGAS